MSYLLLKLLIFLSVFGSFTLHGEVQGPSDSLEEVDYFAKNAISLGLARNFPLQKADEQFLPGPMHLHVAYRYFNKSWLLGIFAQFKMFDLKENNKKFSIFSFGQEILYGFRLNHPIYFYFGGKLMYLAPTESARIPMKRKLEYEVTKSKHDSATS